MPLPRVLLVSMPWTALGEPSLGLAVLKGVCDRAGIACRVRHLNLFLLEHLRAPTYLAIANTFALNDFVFSGVLDPELPGEQRRWLRLRTQEMMAIGLIDPARVGGVDGAVDQLVRLRQDVVPRWLAGHASQLLRDRPTLVGLTCMFDQTVASLALAALIKRRSPETLVALGGYAVREPTGSAVLRAFPCVDGVCVGEGEEVIVPLSEASVGQRKLNDVPGMIVRGPRGTGVIATPATRPYAMDLSPTPNFTDYFTDLRELDQDHAVAVEVDTLPLETSRGCWWGATHHCVFCGIADEDMAYRARSAEGVLDCLLELRRRHGITSFRLSDYILPHRYFTTLLPELARRRTGLRLSCEMKANTTPDRFELLARAGFTEVQPGIESFSSPVLRDMDKGVRAAQNVQTLLLGRRHGVIIHYNLLFGFPTDRPADYRTMVDALPRLYHLQPPLTRTAVQITRYAPLQHQPARFGIAEATHDPAYRVIFSPSFLDDTGFDLDDYCYYFQRPYSYPPGLWRLYDQLTEVTDTWKRQWVERRGDVVVQYEPDSGGMRVLDTRLSPAGQTHELDAVESLVLRACEAQPITLDRLQQRLSGVVPVQRITDAISALDRRALLFRDERFVIGLALPAECYAHAAPDPRRWAVA